MHTPRICSIANFGDIWFPRKVSDYTSLAARHISQSQTNYPVIWLAYKLEFQQDTRYYARTNKHAVIVIT